LPLPNSSSRWRAAQWPCRGEPSLLFSFVVEKFYFCENVNSVIFVSGSLNTFIQGQFAVNCLHSCVVVNILVKVNEEETKNASIERASPF